jgi:hypothetical protein
MSYSRRAFVYTDSPRIKEEKAYAKIIETAAFAAGRNRDESG